MALNQLKNMFLILIASISLGAILLIGVYTLPTDRMFNNIRSSVDFMKTGEVPRWSKDVIHTSLDNFADATMIMKAVYPVQNVIESAMLNPSWSGNLSPAEGLVYIIEHDMEKEISENPFIYPRYWHGYMIVLKPMLLICKAEHLRVLNLYIQFFLTIAALFLLYKKLGMYYAYSFALIILAINPITTVLAFQHTNVYCTMLLTVILILLFNDKLKQGYRYSYFFMIVGIMPAYFDLLTYPMVPLGIGLVIYFALNKEELLKSSGKKLLFKLLDKCFSWSFGYVGMWSGKIALATLLTNFNVFQNAIDELIIRTSHHEGHGFEGQSITVLETIIKNIRSFGAGPLKIFFIISFIYLIYLIVIKHKKFIFNKLTFIALAFTTSLPLMWYAAACNHSFVHNHFAYRELSVLAFSIFAFIIESVPEFKRNGT